MIQEGQTVQMKKDIILDQINLYFEDGRHSPLIINWNEKNRRLISRILNACGFKVIIK